MGRASSRFIDNIRLGRLVELGQSNLRDGGATDQQGAGTSKSAAQQGACVGPIEVVYKDGCSEV